MVNSVEEYFVFQLFCLANIWLSFSEDVVQIYQLKKIRILKTKSFVLTFSQDIWKSVSYVLPQKQLSNRCPNEEKNNFNRASL